MFSIFRNHKALLTLSILLNALLAAFSVCIAFVLESILNVAIEQSWEGLQRMIALSAGYVLLSALVLLLDSLVKKKLVVRALEDIRQKTYQGILRRDPERFHAVNSADYISALTNDAKTVEDNLLVAPLETIGYIFVFLLSAAALFYYSPLIAGILLLSLLAMYILPSSLGRPISRRQSRLSEGLALFTLRLKDQLSGYDVIRSFQLADRAAEDFAAQNRAVSGKRYAVDKLVACSEGLSQMLAAGTQFLVMLLAASLVLRGELTAGAMLGIVQLSGSFTQPVAIIMQSIPRIKGAKPVGQRLQALGEKQPSAFAGSRPAAFRESIAFENVSFGYAPGQPVLRDLSVVLEKNKKYALTGASGSGKTTLVRLLGAGFSGYTGEIRMDGLELHELDIANLLAKISVIHQNVHMFDESIRENISLHRDYPEQAWQSALATSGVEKFLPQMPEGLDTPVGENGAKLSGGQRQRVAVARALIEKKPLLVLDEGTSGVDAPTAYDIEAALLQAAGITLLTVTHNLRPDLLRGYDAVLFMENGRIAEAGRYDDLLAAGKDFAQFAQMAHNE